MMTKAKLDLPELGLGEDPAKRWRYGPRAIYTEIFDRALQLVESVPYTVTLRWLFYNLWQEGWFAYQKDSKKAKAKKRAYDNFSRGLSRMRHSSIEFIKRWPIELADDRRDPIHRTDGFRSATEWLVWTRDNTQCNIDKMVGQTAYVMVAFEAEAMQSQFVYYTEPYGVSLWPFSGMTSIPYKKRLAKHIEWVNARFALPVIILYFGDYDDAGMRIPETSFIHVRKWCRVPFTAYRAGLNWDQVEKYAIQDDPENPGKYQWEAVGDAAAREIVTGALDAMLRVDALREIERKAQAMTDKVKQALGSVAE